MTDNYKSLWHFRVPKKKPTQNFYSYIYTGWIRILVLVSKTQSTCFLSESTLSQLVNMNKTTHLYRIFIWFQSLLRLFKHFLLSGKFIFMCTLKKKKKLFIFILLDKVKGTSHSPHTKSIVSLYGLKFNFPINTHLVATMCWTARTPP